MSYLSVFRCYSVHCKQKNCDGKTRLPLSSPLDIETHRINSPTETAPLIVLCPRCWKISAYLREEFEERVYDRSSLSANLPIYMIEFVCGAIGCEARTRIYVRVPGILPETQGIGRALEALTGTFEFCSEGHSLKKASEKIFRKILEQRESPL